MFRDGLCWSIVLEMCLSLHRPVFVFFCLCLCFSLILIDKIWMLHQTQKVHKHNDNYAIHISFFGEHYIGWNLSLIQFINIQSIFHTDCTKYYRMDKKWFDEFTVSVALVLVAVWHFVLTHTSYNKKWQNFSIIDALSQPDRIDSSITKWE